MIILGIETSCDETALSIILIDGSKGAPPLQVKILANQVLSQIELHKQYGGVFPNLAKREHGRNLIPLLKKTLEESGFGNHKTHPPRRTKIKQTPTSEPQTSRTVLEREPELRAQFLKYIPTIEKPPIDLIVVTAGPGLEPALWVGINFAKALSATWDIPVVAANHMEGHILVALLRSDEENHKSQITNSKQVTNHNNQITNRFPAINYKLQTIRFPALALLISGGHTELVLMKDWLIYEIVGRTRDDAVGEAFDKVARILGLPYPGGPEISKLAEGMRKANQGSRLNLDLPRPMLYSGDLDFSFSGLKTAVLYLVQKLNRTNEISVREGPRPVSVSPRLQSIIAREFEDAVTEVIVEKVKKAIERYDAQTLILGGGVVANRNIRRTFETTAKELGITLKLPAIDHTADNALMIALAGYFNKHTAVTEKTGLLDIKASGNLHF